MAELAIAEVYTRELIAKLDRALAEIIEAGADCDPASILAANGVGVVDLSRQRCLVDENVYAGALHRGRRWERIALGYISPLLPGKLIWQELSKRPR